MKVAIEAVNRPLGLSATLSTCHISHNPIMVKISFDPSLFLFIFLFSQV